MKYLLLLLLSTCVFSSFLPKKSINTPSVQNLLDFAVGSMVSLKVLDSVPDGFPCVNQITSFKNRTLETLNLFEQGLVYSALKLLESTLNDTYSACQAMSNEGKATFENFLKIVQDPYFMQLARGRVKDNIDTLIDDWYLGVDSLNNQSYFNAGVFFGKIPHVLLSGPNDTTFSVNLLSMDSNGTNPGVDFMKGYLESVQVWSSVPDGLQCLDDIASVKEAITQVINLMKQGEIAEAIQLLEDTVKSDMTTCQNSVNDAQTLLQGFVQTVSQPGFFDLAKARLVDNSLTLLSNIEKGTSDLVAGDFYSAGKEFGMIPHVVLSGPDQ